MTIKMPYKSQTAETVSSTLLKLRRHFVCQLHGLVVDDDTANHERVGADIATCRGPVAIGDIPSLARRRLVGVALGMVENVVVGGLALGLNVLRQLSRPELEVG